MARLFGALASSVAKTPGCPSVETFSARWNPASLSIRIIRSQPSVIPRFSAAIEGWWIHSCKRLIASSCLLSAWARTGESAGGGGEAAALRLFGSASVAAPAAAPWRKSLLFMARSLAIARYDRAGGQAPPLRHEDQEPFEAIAVVMLAAGRGPPSRREGRTPPP